MANPYNSMRCLSAFWKNTIDVDVEKKNRFSALASKDKCDETECQLFEKTVAEAVEEALNN